MTETSTTTSTTDEKTYPLALVFLGTHMLERNLPIPINIDMGGPHAWAARSTSIVVRLLDANLPIWVESIHVDATWVEDERAETGAAYVYRHWTGRLPDSGVRVHLYAAIFTPKLVEVSA